MIKKLVKHGNSYALVIDRPILDLLKIDPTTKLNIVTDGKALFISPVVDPKDQNKFRGALRKAHKRYGRMLRTLAE